MKQIICLCGISGSGKTWTRIHDPLLMFHTYVDISEVYAKLHTSDYEVAWNGFIKEIENKLKKTDVVVAEACFTWRQRAKLQYFASTHDIETQFIDMPKMSKSVLLERVKLDYDLSPQKEHDLAYYNARVSQINNLA